MTKESFVLVSLKGNKAKKVAQVLSNKTSRKILDYLADKKKSTETEISKELNLPISTVHYNLKHLMDAKLVKADEFHYSEKGKEINHYSLTNKYIIIAPESSTPGIRDRLKSILPVGLITVAVAGVMQLLSRYFPNSGNFGAKVAEAPVVLAERAVSSGALEVAEDAIASSVAQPVMNVTSLAQPSVQPASNFVVWFLIGALFVILLILLVEWLRNRN